MKAVVLEEGTKKASFLIAAVMASLVCGSAWAASPRPIAMIDGNSVLSFESDSGGGSGARAVGNLVDFDAALQLGADYLRRMQADITEDNAGNGTDGVDESPDDPDDGGWDWRVISPPAPFSHTTAASPTNLYGVTALGLYYAYLETANAALFTAMQDAADHAVAGGASNYRTGSDMKFLMLFNDLYSAVVAPTTVYEDAAKAKYDGRIAAYGGSATLLAEFIRDIRGVSHGYPNGIIAWDVGIYAVVAQMLYDRFGGTYNTDADDIAEVLWQDSFNDTPGYFDIVDDAGWDPTYADVNFYWYTLGVAGLIDAFDASGTHTGEIPGLVTRLLDSQYTGGAISFSYGANAGDEDWQSTAYAMISLGNLDQATYQVQINWMGYWVGATQDGSGGWVYGSGNHYPEVGGENTQGLYFTSNVLTDVIVDDDFAGQADVDVYNVAHGTTHVWGYDAFSIIQDGVDAVNGSTVNVEPGVYEEQVVIDKDDLHLIGSGSGTNPAVDTIIQSPVSLSSTFNSGSYDAFPIVSVLGVTGGSIEALRVDGLGRGNANYKYMGVAFWNAGGDLVDCVVTSVRDTPFSGSQHGVGIYAYNDTGGAYTINITGTTVDDYQKNAMALLGSGMTANLTGCTTTGAGATTVTAQNGIQIGYGAGGTIDGCTVSGNIYTGPNWASTGVLLISGAPVAVTGTGITDNHPGVYCQDTDATFDGVTVSNQDSDSWDGLYAYNTTGTPAASGTSPRAAAAPIVEEADNAGRMQLAVMTVTVSNSQFTGHDLADSWGVSAFATGADAVNLSVNNSEVTDWDYGIVAYDYGYGSPVNLTANYNCIFSNATLGFLSTFAAGNFDAEHNWWGAADGPGPAGPGSGDGVSDGVDYDPWVAASPCEEACGNGIQDSGEECDDGNNTDGDGCQGNCMNPICGDGIVDSGEDCDDGNTDNADACLNACVAASCGDGFEQTGVEECDDGNADNTDACLDTCMDASCGDGLVQTGVEECDDGNADNTDACPDTCMDAFCGDGFVQTGAEECDDGNSIDGDGCQRDCTLPFCGDGIVDAGEQCDDGNTSNTDACLDSCAAATCGDGAVWTSFEECDDGNTDDGDGCSSTCQTEPGPIPTASEWGLIVLGLILLVLGKAYFGRRRREATA